MFDFQQIDPSGRRRTVDLVPHKLASLAEAKMLAEAMLKHTTLLRISADLAVIEDRAGGVLAEVKTST